MFYKGISPRGSEDNSQRNSYKLTGSRKVNKDKKKNEVKKRAIEELRFKKLKNKNEFTKIKKK